MQCPNCYNEVPNTANICGHCGEKVCKGRCDENTKYTTYSNQAEVEVARPSDSNDAGEELAGSSQNSSGSISVQFYADAYALTKGECTDIHWDATGSKNVWINDVSSDLSGAKQVCPAKSTTYLILAESGDGTQISSSLIVQVQEAVAESSSGVEAAKPGRCSLFENLDMKVTYLDWTSGAPLQFHFKMPGGVPGLGKKVAGDSGSWEYSAEIGSYTSSNCDIIQGYEDRLYCSISLPSRFSNSMSPINLNVNGCDSPIYSNQNAFLPEMVDNSSGGSTSGEETAGGSSGEETSGGSSGGETSSGGSSCGAEPSNLDHSNYQAWCSCMGGSYSGPYSEKYWSNCNF